MSCTENELALLVVLSGELSADNGPLLALSANLWVEPGSEGRQVATFVKSPAWEAFTNRRRHATDAIKRDVHAILLRGRPALPRFQEDTLRPNSRPTVVLSTVTLAVARNKEKQRSLQTNGPNTQEPKRDKSGGVCMLWSQMVGEGGLLISECFPPPLACSPPSLPPTHSLPTPFLDPPAWVCRWHECRVDRQLWSTDKWKPIRLDLNLSWATTPRRKAHQK